MDGKLLGRACVDLAKRSHGSLFIRQELPPGKREDGSEQRRTFRRVGYPTVKDAQADLDKLRAVLDLVTDDPDGAERVAVLLQQVAKDRTPIPDAAEVKRKLSVGVELDGKMTVGEWFDQWAAAKKTRDNTTNGYKSHIRVHLKPRIGHHRLDRLNASHLVEMFDAIADQNEVIQAENQARREQVERCKAGRPGRPSDENRALLEVERAKLAAMPPFRRITGPATRQRIRATLRAALNTAITRQFITHNCAEHLEMDAAKRPKALLWTPDRVEHWRRTGEKPSPVMVWTPEQLGVFFDQAEEHRLFALYWLIAMRGPRRGEAIGLNWPDIDLDAAQLTYVTELVQDGWDVVETAPKTDDSAATIGLGPATVEVLRVHQARQLVEQKKAGEKWADTGKVFTTELGEWLHPEFVSDEFQRLYVAAGLPPINLRDLRHVAATLIHAGGGDLHAIKEVLRHSTITLTSDTYTSLLPEVDREIAAKSEGLVPRARKSAQGVVAVEVPE